MADDYGAQVWMELASCVGDSRFTADEPDDQVAQELQRMCAGCEVFRECLRYHAFDDVEGVWAAGSWR